MIWLIGLWVVAARYAFKGITPDRAAARPSPRLSAALTAI